MLKLLTIILHFCCVREKYLLLSICQGNNLSELAFPVISNNYNKFYCRWFSQLFHVMKCLFLLIYMSSKMLSNCISGCNKDSVRAGCKKCGYRKCIKE